MINWEKEFDEKFDDFPFNKRHKSFLRKALEEQEQEHKETRIRMNENYMKNIVDVKKEGWDNLKEQEKRLRLNHDNVTNIILDQECYDGMKGHAPAIMTARDICDLQTNKTEGEG